VGDSVVAISVDIGTELGETSVVFEFGEQAKKLNTAEHTSTVEKIFFCIVVGSYL
jgi:hypothetical protein